MTHNLSLFVRTSTFTRKQKQPRLPPQVGAELDGRLKNGQKEVCRRSAAVIGSAASSDFLQPQAPSNQSQHLQPRDKEARFGLNRMNFFH